MPGRLQIVGEDPLTLLDGAHNPDGMAALVESLPEIVAGHDRVVAVVSILDDKDAAGMLAPLIRRCDAVVFTSSHNPRALPPPTLQSLARQLGGPPSEIGPRPARRAARGPASSPGQDGVVLATGSIYLVADLLRPSGRRTRLDAVNRRDQPSFLTMIGLVALIVAVVILVFFGIGYLFGRAVPVAAADLSRDADPRTRRRAPVKRLASAPLHSRP